MSAPARFLSLLVLAAPLTAVAASDPDQLDVPASGIVAATVEGHSARLLVRANGSAAPLLNRAEAARFGISAGWFGIGVRVKVGPVPVKGVTGVFRFAVGGKAMKRRGAWFERDIAPGLDGALGPGSLAQNVVAFHLRPTIPGERVITLPLVDRGLIGMGTMAGDVFIQFDPLRPRSMSTAAGGVSLANSHRGAFVAPARSEPILFGIIRPLRAMHLAEPLVLGGLPVTEIDVRTVDLGNASAIPDADNPDEITVVAGKQGRHVYRTLHLGADALAPCSSLVFDKARKVIELRCKI